MKTSSKKSSAISPRAAWRFPAISSGARCKSFWTSRNARSKPRSQNSARAMETLNSRQHSLQDAVAQEIVVIERAGHVQHDKRKQHIDQIILDVARRMGPVPP